MRGRRLGDWSGDRRRVVPMRGRRLADWSGDRGVYLWEVSVCAYRDGNGKDEVLYRCLFVWMLLRGMKLSLVVSNRHQQRECLIILQNLDEQWTPYILEFYAVIFSIDASISGKGGL